MIQVNRFLLITMASLLIPALVENSPAAVEPETRTAPAARPVPAAGGSFAPDPSWTTRAQVLRVIDGDTLEVEIRRVVRVRMLGCWAPESKQDPRLPEDRRQGEKAKGQAAKVALAKLAEGQAVTVQIPLDSEGDIAKSITMGRVLGRVWLVSDPSESLSEKQVRKGHATVSKPEELQ